LFAADELEAAGRGPKVAWPVPFARGRK
jgi:hypothetical protein